MAYSNGIFKNVLRVSGIVLGLLIVVLCIHIYWVTRPKAADASTISMARIDFKQPVTQADAGRITTWLYAQKGVDHVLCNPDSKIAVFTFYPVKVNASVITNHLTSQLHLQAERYIPTEEELKKGCPVVAESYTNKIAGFLKTIF